MLKCVKTIICLVLFSVLFSSLASFADEEKSEVDTILASLLQRQKDELEQIAKDADELKLDVPAKSSDLLIKTHSSSRDFQKLQALMKVDRSNPSQLTILAEQARRLNDSLTQDIDPMREMQSEIGEKLEQLDVLEANLQSVLDENNRPLTADIARIRRTLTASSESIEATVKTASALSAEISSKLESVNNSMTQLWLTYYRSGIRNLFNINSWANELKRLPSIRSVLALRLSTDIPTSASQWGGAALNFFTLLILLTLLFKFASKPVAEKLPEPFSETWRLILRNSCPYLVLGASLHYSAWSAGNQYQILSFLGNLCLCWGQMQLAWDFCICGKDSLQHKSPLWPMFMPLIIGMILLFLDPYPLLMSFLWFMLMAQVFRQAQRRRKNPDTFSAVLLTGFTVTSALGVIMTPFGLARMSIFIGMAYTALAVGLQQLRGFLHTAQLIQKELPTEGAGALVCGIIFSVVVPIMLALGLAAPIFWVIAYPGGSHFIQYIIKFGVNIGSFSLNIIQLVSILTAFYLLRSISGVGMRFLESMQSRGKLSPIIAAPLKIGFTFVVWGVFALYVLRVLGFNLTNLAVIAGGLSVGIGLGLQGLVQNIISGLSLIFGRNIREGDVVDIGDITGVVSKLGLRHTQVKTYDNAIVFVPNGELLTSKFTNWTHNNRIVRRRINVGLAYGTDMPAAMSILKTAVQNCKTVSRRPEVLVFFADFGASSLDLTIFYWILNVDLAIASMNEVRLAIEKACRENGIEISFPQMDLHIKDFPAAAPASSDPFPAPPAEI